MKTYLFSKIPCGFLAVAGRVKSCVMESFSSVSSAGSLLCIQYAMSNRNSCTSISPHCLKYGQTILVSKAPAVSFSADSMSVFSLHSLDILDFKSKLHNPGH